LTVSPLFLVLKKYRDVFSGPDDATELVIDS